MPGQKFLPHGTDVSFASNDIGGLVNTSTPDASKGEVESTDHDSGRWREYFPGLREGGTVELTMRKIDGDAGQAALRTNYEADRATEECVITFPAEATTDSAVVTVTFDAFVVNIDGDEMPADQDDPAEFTATLRLVKSYTKATA